MLKAIVVGNVGSDPELKYAAAGQPLLRFSVASNYRVKGQSGEWSDATEWVRVVVFGKRAEMLQPYLSKGTRVYVDGRLEARPWTDRAGNVQAGLELTASDVEFMSGRQDDQTVPRNTVNQPATSGASDDSDLPF